jgi:hypothetical protein
MSEKLEIRVAANPAEAAIAGLIHSYLKEVATLGLGDTASKALMYQISKVFLDRGDNILVTVPTVAAGTGNLVMRLRFSDGFNRAFAMAAEDFDFLTHTSITIN